MRPALAVLIALAVLVVGGSAVLQLTGDSSSATGDDAAAADDASSGGVVEPVRDVPELTLPDPLPARTLQVPILMYHRIAVLNGDEPAPTAALTVDPGEFQLQMAWLHDQGYETVTQLELYRALEEGGPLPAKPVLLSFDGGYRGIATLAAPVMSRYDFTGTAYVTAARIAQSKKAAPTWLTWPQLRILEQRGWDIGAHTDLSEQDEVAALKTLRRSRSLLERRLGHPVQWLSYPGGAIEESVLDQVREAGYVLAATTEPGTTQSAQDPLGLQRIRMTDTTGVRGLAAALP